MCIISLPSLKNLVCKKAFLLIPLKTSAGLLREIGTTVVWPATGHGMLDAARHAAKQAPLGSSRPLIPAGHFGLAFPGIIPKHPGLDSPLLTALYLHENQGCAHSRQCLGRRPRPLMARKRETETTAGHQPQPAGATVLKQ